MHVHGNCQQTALKRRNFRRNFLPFIIVRLLVSEWTCVILEMFGLCYCQALVLERVSVTAKSIVVRAVSGILFFWQFVRQSRTLERRLFFVVCFRRSRSAVDLALSLGLAAPFALLRSVFPASLACGWSADSTVAPAVLVRCCGAVISRAGNLQDRMQAGQAMWLSPLRLKIATGCCVWSPFGLELCLLFCEPLVSHTNDLRSQKSLDLVLIIPTAYFTSHRCHHVVRQGIIV